MIASALLVPFCAAPIALNITSCGSTYKNTNPHETADSEDVIQTLESIKRMDNDGYLYFMENVEDYNNNTTLLTLVYLAEQRLKDTPSGFVDACSAFCAQDFEDNMITGRAYDFPHEITEGGKTVETGLNMMIHTPKNVEKGVLHESIGTSDAYLVGSNVSEGDLKNGSLDDNKTDISFASLLPYITTDGINDAGLSATILLLPNDKKIQEANLQREEAEAITVTKPESALEEISIPRIIRIVLDNCETVEEAETMFKTHWCNRILGCNFHVLVTDKTGKSRLFEYYDDNFEDTTQKLMIIDTNVATNFYQRFSNAATGMPQLTGLKRQADYHYGYSQDGYRNTYDRFNAIASMLDFYTPTTKTEGKPYNAIMKEQTMDSILRTISLYPSPKASADSQTQYSCLYNANNLTQKIYSFSNLDHSWTYSLKDHKFI